MIEKKCKICGEWVNSKKIAMHYWNIHHVKYSDYRENEETREVAEEVTAKPIEVKNEKTANEETKATNTATATATATEVVVEAPAPVIETETVDNGLVNTPEPKPVTEADMWKETAKYFEGKVTNEAKRELRTVQVPYRDTESINEWCN